MVKNQAEQNTDIAMRNVHGKQTADLMQKICQEREAGITQSCVIKLSNWLRFCRIAGDTLLCPDKLTRDWIYNNFRSDMHRHGIKVFQISGKG